MLASDPIACKIMPLFEEMILPLFSRETQQSFRALVVEAAVRGAA